MVDDCNLRQRRFPRIAVIGALLILSFAFTSASVSRAHAANASPPCSTDQLVLSTVSETGGGHSAYRILIQNRGDATCQLHGYATIAGVTSGGHTYSAVDQRLGFSGGIQTNVTALPIVKISHRGWASFGVDSVDNRPSGSAGCPIITLLRVRLPGSTDRQLIKVWMADCSHIYAHPIVSGKSAFER